MLIYGTYQFRLTTCTVLSNYMYLVQNTFVTAKSSIYSIVLEHVPREGTVEVKACQIHESTGHFLETLCPCQFDYGSDVLK